MTLPRLFIFLSLTLCHNYPLAAPTRVVTIGGAVTEIVYQLGAGDSLVGNDTTSYFPAEAEMLPKVGYQRALSAEGVLSLEPELIIMTEEAGPPKVIEQLKAAGISIVTVRAGRAVEDVIDNINVIASALEREEQAQQVVSSIINAREKLAAAIAEQNNKQRVLFILQHGGGAPMVAGNDTAANSIINLAGASNAVEDYSGYKPLTPEAAINQAPDAILITDQGLEQAGGIDNLLHIPGLALTPAGKNKRVIAMDSLLLLGFGPRTVDAATQLNKKLQQK